MRRPTLLLINQWQRNKGGYPNQQQREKKMNFKADKIFKLIKKIQSWNWPSSLW